VGTTYIQEAIDVTRKVNFRLPDELIEKADVAAEVSHKNRTDIITEALQQYLQEAEDDEKFKEAVIELYLDDDIGFDTLKQFIGRQDAESVQASKALLEQGEDLANELAEL
jgi:metal-responsive CopG/Arc/MetJ family transcriptional regulator